MATLNLMSLKRNPVAIFLCRLVCAFLLLAIPWPGLTDLYNHMFRSLARAVFASDEGQRELTFETPDENREHPHALRVTIVNRALMHANGSGPVRNVDVGFGTQPVALLLALIFATPISWKRRWRAVLFGLPGIHCVLLLCLGFIIWNESSNVGLVTFTPFWQEVANAVREIIGAQISLAMPVIVWILVTFRTEDRIGNLGRFILGPADAGGVTAPAAAQSLPAGKRAKSR